MNTYRFRFECILSCTYLLTVLPIGLKLTLVLCHFNFIGPPEPSIIVNASCNVLQATVVWMTAFNGGQTQQFYLIAYTENEEYLIVETSVFSDKKEEVKFKTFTLRAGHYSFRIVGKNQFGNASSPLYKKTCTVKGQQYTHFWHDCI